MLTYDHTIFSIINLKLKINLTGKKYKSVVRSKYAVAESENISKLYLSKCL